MSDQPKFLLGQGEALTKPGRYRGGVGDVTAPYSLQVQREFLAPQLKRQQLLFDKLPDAACPDDLVVSMMTLHPQYYSRSAFPSDLFAEADLRLVGSMPRNVRPRDGRGSNVEGGIPSTVLFVAGTRKSFAKLAETVPRMVVGDPAAGDLVKIESIEAQTADERVQGVTGSKTAHLEVVLHFNAETDRYDLEKDFLDFAEKSGLHVHSDRVYQSRGLWFAPAEGTPASAKRAADFSIVRAIRPLPVLRPLEQLRILRAASEDVTVTLPAEGPLDPNCRVAVFDGGLPEDHPFALWATAIEPLPSDKIGAPVSDFLDHGVGVTSALLFGHMQPGLQPQPYCHVDHYRVLGQNTTDPTLFDVLLCIDRILQQESYNFASLSIGPDEVVGEDKVSAWTTMLDDHFYQTRMLGTIAIGNDGLKASPQNRVQVPSDCVNALAVGASDGVSAGWKRAPYSCVGPGRAPGLIKPDVVHFGGVKGGSLFRFLLSKNRLAESYGTSFASPAVMRLGAGISAHFGPSMTPLSIRTLIIHSADDGGNPKAEVGWGLPVDDLSEITVCPDGSVRVLYQGSLDPTKVRRATVPIPDADTLSGKVTIKATFCYTCMTDPHTPGDYTRAGLGITFRPHVDKLGKPPKDAPEGWKADPDFPEPKSFFEGVGRKTEQALRYDAFKWDTVRHAQHTFMGTTLKQPVFDIHYQARSPGRRTSPNDAPRLRYSLVITITAAKHPDLYERVVKSFPMLAPIVPRTQLPTIVRAKPDPSKTKPR